MPRVTQPANAKAATRNSVSSPPLCLYSHHGSISLGIKGITHPALTFQAESQRARQRLSFLHSYDWIFFTQHWKILRLGNMMRSDLLCLCKAFEKDDTADQHCGYRAVKSIHMLYHSLVTWVSRIPSHRPFRETTHPCCYSS